jgi:azurin
MKRFRLIALLALSLPVAMTALAAQAPGPKPTTPMPPTTKDGGAARTSELTGGDDMKYNVTEIKAKPGETIKIQLKNVGTLPKMAMAHNVVVVKPTTSGA